VPLHGSYGPPAHHHAQERRASNSKKQQHIQVTYLVAGGIGWIRAPCEGACLTRTGRSNSLLILCRSQEPRAKRNHERRPPNQYQISHLNMDQDERVWKRCVSEDIEWEKTNKLNQKIYY